VVVGAWLASQLASTPVQWSGSSQPVTGIAAGGRRGLEAVVVAEAGPVAVVLVRARPLAVAARGGRGSWLASQLASTPLQWSGPSQGVSLGSPQAVVAA
jgi:hypothetical protein